MDILRKCLAIAILIVQPGWVFAQDRPTAGSCGLSVKSELSPINDTRRGLARAISLARPTESGLFRSNSLGSAACADSLPYLEKWSTRGNNRIVQPSPMQIELSGNSAYPKTSNDGAGWQGVGLNAAATAGATAQWRFLRAAIGPEFFFNQNDDFVFPISTREGVSQFANPYHPVIDFPKRMGNESITTVSPGQSYLQASWRKFAVTVSTENLWIGAAEVYPLLLSNTAAGFPHLRLGTQQPVDIWFATLEAQLIFGNLTESDYWDGENHNDEHFFGTTMLVMQPKVIPNLYLSIVRAVHDSTSAFSQDVGFFVNNIISSPFGGTSGNNTPSNALGLLYARWILPESQFEVYVEWGREDTPGGWLDILREPDWTQAYVLGFQKAFSKPNRLMRLYGEAIHLGESAPARGGRGFYSFYTHDFIRQGHTNRGQMLGAAIGPGSDAQLVGLDVYEANSRTSGKIERARYDDDTYYRRFSRRWGETRHDAEITLSASRAQFIGQFELEAGLQFSRRYGRDFVNLDISEEDLIENNWGARINARWQPRF